MAGVFPRLPLYPLLQRPSQDRSPQRLRLSPHAPPPSSSSTPATASTPRPAPTAPSSSPQPSPLPCSLSAKDLGNSLVLLCQRRGAGKSTIDFYSRRGAVALAVDRRVLSRAGLAQVSGLKTRRLTLCFDVVPPHRKRRELKFPQLVGCYVLCAPCARERSVWPGKLDLSPGRIEVSMEAVLVQD